LNPLLLFVLVLFMAESNVRNYFKWSTSTCGKNWFNLSCGHLLSNACYEMFVSILPLRMITTQMWWLYIIQQKFDVFSCFKKFQLFSFHEIGDQILKICFDCGGEFMNIAFQEHLVEHEFIMIWLHHTHLNRMVLKTTTTQLLKWCVPCCMHLKLIYHFGLK
jgi:hypothetical protein